MTDSAANPSAQPITSVLVANRGEIARRVFRTCRDRGLATVAVFSDPDADSPHVRAADRAVALPGATPADTYLRGDLVIAAALAAGADTIHPGYGFLSENADFARAVGDAGLVWVGPAPDTIAAMGSKVESKRLMAAAGVPVLARLDPEVMTEADLPVIIKASSGGGGRGMRVIRDLADLPAQLASAAREAESAFGDATVFCERYLAGGRHVEVQVMADGHGTVWTLGERECSLQRRHQKVIEEAPSPLVERIGPGLRSALMDAAHQAAAAIRYVGAGTIEFLAEQDGSFHFLEMNTRLQVEHPVTENVTRVDLVGLQLDVAAGLPLAGDEPAMRGHSIEARLYAEDATRDWQPQSGTLASFAIPGVEAEFRPTSWGIRLDSGVTSGSVIGGHYDPMLAKVTATAPNRIQAARLLARALQHATIHGLTSNRDLLVGALRDPDFLSGEFDTGFFEAHRPADLARSAAGDPVLAAIVAALADASRQHAQAPGIGPNLPGGWRNLPSASQERSYQADDDRIDVAYRWERDGLVVDTPSLDGLEVVAATPDEVVVELAGVRQRATVTRHDDMVHVTGPDGPTALRVVPRFADPHPTETPGTLVAPMPGSVIKVAVAVDDVVATGTPLLWLEAMKMEHVITATAAGRVTRIVAVGAQVEPGAVLAIVDPMGAEVDEASEVDE